MTTRLAPFAFALLAAATGCQERPRAPALTHDPVYANDRVGVRFTPPPGWSLIAKSEPPAGKLKKPVMLVAYNHPTGERPTDLELLAVDGVVEGADLGQFLLDNPVGRDKWNAKEAAKPVTVNGTPATRLTLTRQGHSGTIDREVTAFRRGDRTYLFFITYVVDDRTDRDAAHKCVEAVEWR
jgi:hypothetical protein